MNTQKIINKLMANPGVDPIEFLKARNWPMTGIQIESVLTHVLGRLPTKEEVQATNPQSNFEDRKVFRKVFYESKYGKL